VAFYYSRKQMQKLSVDLETKVLNDLASMNVYLAMPNLSLVSLV
jgi:hypothetical protein